jgi:signal transduction histidine kinase
MQARELERPVLLAQDGLLVQINGAARALFPSLKEGEPLPDALLAPEEEGAWEGSAVLEGRGWRVSAGRDGEKIRYELTPVEQSALSQGQLDGALYQLRRLMSGFHRELSPYVSGKKTVVERESREEFARDYYRMLRLMDHLDLLRDAADGQLRPRLEPVEVGVSVNRAVLECDGLLREKGLRVEYRGVPGNLMIRGDMAMLRTALLELISNCARRLKPGDTITVKVTGRGDRALLCVTDSGPAASGMERAVMTTRGGLPRIPVGDMGAGLGLSVAEEIIRAHGGSMLISAGEGAARVFLSLPLTRKLGGEEPEVFTPERDAGMSPYLIGLADVLTGDMILEDWVE